MNSIFRIGLLAMVTAGSLVGCNDHDSAPPAPPPPPPPAPPEFSVPVSVAPGGCPIETRDGKFLYTAAGPADTNGLDIWALRRTALTDTYDMRTKLAAPISLDGTNDFCPLPAMDDWLLFVSTRDGADKCGTPGPGLTGVDIFVTRYTVTVPTDASTALLQTAHGEPQRLACYPDGPNTAGTKFSPSLLGTPDGAFLFYSSNHDGVAATGSQDIFMSPLLPNGTYGPGVAVTALNTTFEDQQPNVSRDGLIIVFASNRGGNMDIYMSKRATTADAWGTPVNLSSTFNFPTAGSAETRPSISWDMQRLYYGADGLVYLSKRTPPAN